jgi:hypothetical protein
MLTKTNSNATRATAAQAYFDEVSMTDAELDAFLARVDQENEKLFGVDHNDREEAPECLSPDEQLSNAVDSRDIGELVEMYEPDSITVLGKYRVSPSVYLETAKRLESIEDYLVEGQEYYPDELIGFGLWVQFPPVMARQFELCLMHFAAMKDYPLQDTYCGSFVWGGPKGALRLSSASNSDGCQIEKGELDGAARQLASVRLGGFL